VRFFEQRKKNNFSPRILYQAKLSLKIDGGIKVFHNKKKLKQYMTIKPPLQKFQQQILNTKVKSKQNHDVMGNIKPEEKKRHIIRE
jgi:hypothetical protein